MNVTCTYDQVKKMKKEIHGVKSNLTDGLNEGVVRNFPDIKGHINEKEKLADQLTRRVMGYWVTIVNKPKTTEKKNRLMCVVPIGINGSILQESTDVIAETIELP